MLAKSTFTLFDEKQLISAIESEKLSALDLSAVRVKKDEKAEIKTIATLSEHSSFVHALTVLPDGRLASGSDDATIRLWDVKSKKCVATLNGHTNTVYALAVLPNGRLASGSFDTTIRLWDAKNEKCVAILREHTDYVCGLAVLPDGRLASGSHDKTIRIWDLQSGKSVAILRGHKNWIKRLIVLPDGRLASGSYDKNIRLWDLQSGKCAAVLHGHTHDISALAVLPNGRLASGAGWDKTIRLWDVNSAKCVATFEHADYLDALSVLPDGRLASGSGDNIIRLWDVESGKCIAVPSGHERSVTVLEVLPDGCLASGSADKTIRLWEVANLRPLALPHLKAVLTALQKNKSIRALNLQNTALNDEAVPELINLLQPNTALTALDIRNAAMTVQGAKALAQGLVKRSAPLQIWNPDGSSTTLKPVAPAAILPPEQKSDSRQVPDKKSEELFNVSFAIKYEELTFGKEVGRGGFGVVYQGTWRHDEVAIKQLLAPSISQKALKAFKTESEIMAKLRSRYLVQFYGYCLSPKYTLVMQYMPKGTLSAVLHSEAPLDWTVRAQIITDMACGLDYLHKENILHRDLKSLNVLLDEQYRAKLSDFGLSQVKNESRSMMTKGGGPVGTFAWMAPELSEFEAKYTPKADIYSLGVTIWEVASRNVPFASAINPALVPMWVAQGKREKIPDDCPKKIASLIRFCWDTDPDKRPTAAEIVNYLKSNQDEFKPTPANLL